MSTNEDMKEWIKQLDEEYLEREKNHNEAELLKQQLQEKNEKLALKIGKRRKIVYRVLSTTLITGILISGAVGIYKIGKKQGSKETIDNEQQINIEPNLSIFDAPDEVILDWANYAYDKYCEKSKHYDNKVMQDKAANILDSNFRPMFEAYQNYTDTKEESYRGLSEGYYNEFKNQAIQLENELGDGYFLTQTPFTNAIVIDGNVYVKLTDINHDEYSISNIPEDSIINEGTIYVLKSYINNEKKMNM